MSTRARASRKPGQAPHLLSVYDGAIHVGDIKDCGKHGVIAYAIGERDRIKIGTFANRIEAMRGVSRSRG
jgi:hypothetical protein